MFKLIKGTAPGIFANIFNTSNNMNYNLRHFSDVTLPLVNSVYNATETISFMGPTVWDITPSEIKGKESLEEFKCTIIIIKITETRKLSP